MRKEKRVKVWDLSKKEFIDCNCGCHYQSPYGFVPEDGCIKHDTKHFFEASSGGNPKNVYNPNNKIADIRKKAIEANPEIMIGIHDLGTDKGIEPETRPIRLADILITLPKYASRGILRDSKNEVKIHEDAAEIIWLWNFKDNNLENQSKETIDFIHGLL